METPSTPDRTTNETGARLPAGTVLQGRYRIGRELGSGGMGTVYEAIDQRLETTVALKETFSTDDRLRRQFGQEARLLAQLHHPCLPRVTDYFRETGRAFLVMQFISGPDLAQILARRPGPFAPPQVLAWADQLLDALVYLHERDRQIIHRDIKPHNLKLMSNGRIALLDFGLAKAHAADQSTTNSSISIFGYTRRYSPPEQIRDLGTTAQSDIYALGATLYHLLTGMKPPDSMERVAAVANSESDPLKPASDFNAAVNTELSALLSKAMSLQVKERFKSASEFREALKSAGRSDLPAPVAVKSISLPSNEVPLRKSDSKIDPFDSYAILKPEQDVFNLPRSSRRPWLFAAVLGAALVMLVSAYPSRVVDSVTGILDSPRANAPLTDATVLHSNKSSAANGSAWRGGASVPTVNHAQDTRATLKQTPEHEPQHKEESEKRRATQTPAAPATRPAEVKPPAFSISPE